MFATLPEAVKSSLNIVPSQKPQMRAMVLDEDGNLVTRLDLHSVFKLSYWHGPLLFSKTGWAEPKIGVMRRGYVQNAVMYVGIAAKKRKIKTSSLAVGADVSVQEMKEEDVVD